MWNTFHFWLRSSNTASISTSALPFPSNISPCPPPPSKWPFWLHPILPIKLMRMRRHSSGRGCLLSNWRLIFCGCHFRGGGTRGCHSAVAAVKGDEGAAVLSVTQSDGSVMCSGLETLLSRLSVSLALHLSPLFRGLRFHFATPSISPALSS